MGNMDSEKKRNNNGWGWKSLAFIALIGIVAVAVAAVSSSKGTAISLFGFFNQLCSCGSQNKLTGLVEDCCCDYETVDSLNNQVLHPSLQKVVKTPFFRYFKAWCPVTLFEAARGTASWQNSRTVGELQMRPFGGVVLHFQINDLLDGQVLFEHTAQLVFL